MFWSEQEAESFLDFHDDYGDVRGCVECYNAPVHQVIVGGAHYKAWFDRTHDAETAEFKGAI